MNHKNKVLENLKNACKKGDVDGGYILLSLNENIDDQEIEGAMTAQFGLSVLQKAIRAENNRMQSRLVTAMPGMDLATINKDLLLSASKQVKELTAYQGLYHTELLAKDANEDMIPVFLAMIEHPEFDMSKLTDEQVEFCFEHLPNKDAQSLLKEQKEFRQENASATPFM